METRRGLAVRRDSHRNVERQANLLGNKISLIPAAVVPIKKPHVNENKENESCISGAAFGGPECFVSRESVADIEHYLMHTERARRLETNFLHGLPVDARMRTMLLDWAVQVQTKLRLCSETFYMACNLIDRVIKPLQLTKHNLQLYGLACIFVASKFEEVLLPNVHDFLYMGGSCDRIESLFAAEKNILKSMQFNLNLTSPAHFLRKLRFHIPTNHGMFYEMGKLLVDVAIVDYKTSWWLPSEQAAAGVYLAYVVHQRGCPNGLLDMIKVSPEDAIAKAKFLASRVPGLLDPAGRLQGLRLKYKGSASLDKLDQSFQLLTIYSSE